MKKIIALTVALVIVSTALFAQSKAGKVDATAHATYYSCPTHPEVTGHKPGKCPKCGMDLKETEIAYSCPNHLEVKSDKPGICAKCGASLTPSPKEKMKMEVMKSYTCPMHPDITSDKPGKCSKCGMDLIEKKDEPAGHHQ